MSISATISGTPVSVGNASFNIQDPLEDRAVLTFTVLDSAGTASYTRGDPVTFSDPGILSYTGYVQSDQPTKDGLSLPYVEHVITCMDGVYNLGKRSNSQNYLNWVAGNIAVDFVRRDLANEGITIAAAMHRDTTDTDFNQGTLNGLVGALHTPGDGDLELPLAGSTVTISEVTQANFQTGTLTNVSSPVAGGLTPTLTPTFQLIGTGSGTIYVAFWAGSQVIGTSDTLVYSTFNDPTAGAGSISFTCSDGSNYQFNPGTDTTTNPGTGWWARTITLPAGWNGKTITQVQAVMTSSSGSSCNAYFQNVHLGSASGSPFFSTTLNTTPYATVLSGYTNVTTQVVNTNVLGVTTMRQSSPYSLTGAGILKSAYLSYVATQPPSTAITIKISSNGGATWYTCANNALIPTACLVPGMNLSGISLLVQETFTNTGTDPAVYATLTSLTITIQPAAAATKTDVSYIVDTQAGWQAGTLTNVVAQPDNSLTIPSSQVFGTTTAFDNGGAGYTWLIGRTITPSSTLANGAQINVPGNSVKHTHVQIAGPGTYTSMTLYMQVFVSYNASINNVVMSGPTYLNPQWNSTAGTFGYCAMISTTTVSGSEAVWLSLVRGSAGGSTTTIAGPVQLTGAALSQDSISGQYGSSLTIVYSSGSHKIYANNILMISATDSTYTTASDVGMYAISAGTDSPGVQEVTFFLGFGVTPNSASSGTFVSPATSLTPVGTYGTSLVDWSVLTPSVLQNPRVEASIDGGTTYTACTNGQPIPGITAGTSMSGKSLVMRVTLLSAVLSNIETINGLRVLVLGQYNATGTRSTAPMGNDMVISRTVGSGWGTAFDGQTWTQSGTGTTAVGSGEATIANTTGSVNMQLGTMTWTDEEATVRFSLSASTITAGINLRYIDSNNYYRLTVTTTTIAITKKVAGTGTTLATGTVALSTSTFYRLRFRIVGVGPTNLYGKVWPDGTLEPGDVAGVLSTTNPQWTITATS